MAPAQRSVQSHPRTEPTPFAHCRSILAVIHSVGEAADRSYSFIVCATKCLSDIRSASSILEPLLKTLSSSLSTTVVLLQNGVGIEEDVQKALAGVGAENPVLSGCAWTDSTALDGGSRIVQHGNERLVLGCHAAVSRSASAGERGRADLERFCQLLQTGGVAAETVKDIDAARWRKVLWYAYNFNY